MKKLIALSAALLLAVGAYAATYPDISIKDLKAAIESKSVTVLDANGSESYNKGHIPTAIDFAASPVDDGSG